jgi:hypothetical protein
MHLQNLLVLVSGSVSLPVLPMLFLLLHVITQVVQLRELEGTEILINFTFPLAYISCMLT